MLPFTPSISFFLVLGAVTFLQSVHAGTLTTGGLYEDNIRSRRGVAKRAQPSILPVTLTASLPDGAYIRCPDTVDGKPLSLRSIANIDDVTLGLTLTCTYRIGSSPGTTCSYDVVDGTVQVGSNALCPPTLE